ncbi:hypothetical protein I4U23_020152 [Adineta vaga]|nr:hypothetical protein I4U23_020152 [Adineta vaga]
MNESIQAYENIYGEKPQHHSSWTHELLSGAAGFQAMRAYENHVRNSGEQVSHPLMKEMLASFAAAEVDKLFETKGLDFFDREKAKFQAIEQAHRLADEKYGVGGTFISEEHQHHHHHQHHEE